MQTGVDRLNEKIQDGNAKLREIRLERRSTLEGEERSVRFAVLGWMPALVLVLGLVLFVRRKRMEIEARRTA